MNCPICDASDGFHTGVCYDYSHVPESLTRPPGGDAFKAWLDDRRSVLAGSR